VTIEPWVSADDLERSDSDLAPTAARLASRILFSLTGRIYSGEKTATETYVSPSSPYDQLKLLTMTRYGIGAGCFRVSPFRIGTHGEMRIPLRRRPVQAVQSVVVTPTGAVVDPSEYEVTSQAYLTVSAAVPVMSSLTVEYVYGLTPPEDGVEAARALADELVMLFGGGEGDDCRLKNVTSFSRNGVNYEIEDARTILTDGRTGIPEVDLFVASVNPKRAQMRSRVLSPDAHTVR
jgi:hypothetical protein